VAFVNIGDFDSEELLHACFSRGFTELAGKKLTG
jgi:hypothetical protein